MADGVPARWRADFLLTIRLDNVDLAVSLQGTIDKIIEPGLRQFPVFLIATTPYRLSDPAVSQPFAIAVVERQTHAQQLARTAPPQDDRYFSLLPNLIPPNRDLDVLQLLNSVCD